MKAKKAKKFSIKKGKVLDYIAPNETRLSGYNSMPVEFAEFATREGTGRNVCKQAVSKQVSFNTLVASLKAYKGDLKVSLDNVRKGDTKAIANLLKTYMQVVKSYSNKTYQEGDKALAREVK